MHSLRSSITVYGYRHLNYSTGIHHERSLIGIGLLNPLQPANALAIKRPRHLLKKYIEPKKLLKQL